MQKISRAAGERIAADQNRQAVATKAAWQKADIGGALQKSVSSGVSGAAIELAKLAPILAAAFAGSAAIGAADTYNRFTNQLKVAGLEGAKLTAVQEHLYQAALKNGAALEPLGQLYGRVSQSAKELGLSQSGILNITDAVAAAVRVSGGSAEQASGALLQLSQALAAGTVRAEEFNSINEGLTPLLQAAAGASEKYGGSVAKMRADVLKGALSSSEFARLIQAGLGDLEKKAASASLTVEQSMQNVQTALIKGISTVDQTYGATQKLSEALTWLSQNLDIIGKSLLVLGGIFAVTAAPAIGQAAAALGTYTAGAVGAGVASVRLAAFQTAMAASMRGTTVAAESAALAMRGLMSSTGLGLAIVAVTAALGLFAAKAMESAEAERQFEARLKAGNSARAEAKKAADQARVATGDLSKAEMDALTHTANLTGQADKLADARYRQAAATKAAALEEARLATAQAGTDVKTARKALAKAQETEVRKTIGPIGDAGERGMRAGQATAGADPLATIREGAAQNEAVVKAQANLDAAQANNKDAWDKFYAIQSSKLETYVPKPPAAAAGKPEKGAAGRERRGDTAIEAAETELRNATRSLAYTRQEQHEATLVSLREEYEQQTRKLDEAVADKQLLDADAQIAKGKYKEAYEQKLKAENAAYQRDLDEQRRAVAARDLDTQLEALRVQEGELGSLADHAKTLKQKQAYEAAALAKRQEADRLSFAAAQEQLRLDLQKLGLTKQEIDTRLAARQSVFDQGQKNERGNLVADQRKEAPGWGDWLKDLGTSSDGITQKLQGIASNGLNSIVDGLANAAVGAGSLKDAFADTVKSMIANLIKLGIQFLIFETLGRAFGVPGLGKAAIGLNKHAAGTNFSPGGLSLVGEAGPELVALPRGAQVVPNNLLKTAFQSPRGSGATQIVQNFTTHVDATNAVLRSDIDRQIYQANLQTLQAARQMAAKDSGRAGRNRL